MFVEVLSVQLANFLYSVQDENNTNNVTLRVFWLVPTGLWRQTVSRTTKYKIKTKSFPDDNKFKDYIEYLCVGHSKGEDDWLYMFI